MDMSDFENDDIGITDSQIKTISGLVKRQVDLEKEVKDAEDALKKLKARLRKVAEVDLPDALVEAGTTLFRTEDGYMVDLKEDMKASIPAKNKNKAIAWLIANDLESLVKENVVVPFDKGEGDKVKAVVDLLQGAGVVDFSVAASVHTNQVKASLKELIENGTAVPEDLFGIYWFKQAVIKTP